MTSAVSWLESLSPWPEEFGLARIRELLARLDHPERRYPAIHVVGTNGKSTTAHMIEALLAEAGLAVGTYLSPHVLGWEERIRVHAVEADLDGLLREVRAAGVEDVTQFEALTAAALLAFSRARVDVAVVEAGLGGRHDATNVLEARVVVLTNVALEHAEFLGPNREAIAGEKLAVVAPGATVILGEPEWEDVAHGRGARTVVHAEGNVGVAVAAAEAFLGRPVSADAAGSVRVPGRFEVRGEDPLEIWDGAHNPDGVRYLVERLPDRSFVLVVSILGDKEVDAMLRSFAERCDRMVATSSRNPRALGAAELADRARRFFRHVLAVDDPSEALSKARALAGADGVLVSGSLYLLADLAAVRPTYVPWDTLASG